MKKILYVSLLVFAWLVGAVIAVSVTGEAEGTVVRTPLQVRAYTDTFTDYYDCVQVCSDDSVENTLNPMYFENRKLEVR